MAKKIKALWIVERFSPQKGGVAASAARQIERLAPHLDRLDVVQLRSDLPAGRIEVETTPGGALLHVLGRARRDEESLRLLYQVAVELGRTYEYDLVQGFYGTHAGYVAVQTARRLSRPSVVSLRGNDVDLGLFQGNRIAPLRAALEHADRVLVVSQEMAEMVRGAVGRRKGVCWIPNGVDVRRYTPGRPTTETLESFERFPRPWIGFVGQLRFKKGLQVVLDLVDYLAEEDYGALIAVGGGREDERDALERWRARSPAAAQRFHEVPYSRDVSWLLSCYRALDLLVFPSFWDGMPNALIEAMACECVVLGTAVGGIKDVIVDGENGFLMPLTELERFPRQVRRILALPEEARRRIGAAARARVVERFSADAELDALLAVYNELLRGHA